MPGFMSVALSGTAGAGKSALIKQLRETRASETYGWPVYAVGQIIRDRYKQAHPDRAVTFEEFCRNVPHEQNMQFYAELKLRLESSNMIGDSRFIMNLDPAKCLRVFLDAPLMVRALRRQGAYPGMSPIQVAEFLNQRDLDDFEKGMKMQGSDYRDPSHYHLVLNTSIMSIAQEVESINRGLRQARRAS